MEALIDSKWQFAGGSAIKHIMGILGGRVLLEAPCGSRCGLGTWIDPVGMRLPAGATPSHNAVRHWVTMEIPDAG